jgi:hypothetical protein
MSWERRPGQHRCLEGLTLGPASVGDVWRCECQRRFLLVALDELPSAASNEISVLADDRELYYAFKEIHQPIRLAGRRLLADLLDRPATVPLALVAAYVATLALTALSGAL